MPVNRKNKPETRDPTLQEAIAVPGLPTLSTKTANSYLDMFRRFWDWAEKHGRAPEKLFVDLKVKAGKKKDDGRKAFTPAQTQRLLQELTENTSGLVKSDDHK
jgi:integrase